MDPNTQKVNQLLQKYSAGNAGKTNAPTVDPELDAIFNSVAPAVDKTTTPAPEKKSVGGFIKNVGSSGADLIGGIVDALVHPARTLKGVGTIALGAGQKLVGYDGEAASAVDQIVDFYKTRYGKDIKETLYNDPIGVLADLSTVLGGGAALLKGVGTVSKLSTIGKAAGVSEQALRYGKMLDEAAIATDPLRVAGKGAGIISRETGLTDTAKKAKAFTTSLFTKTDEPVVRQGTGVTMADGVRKTVKEKITESGIDDQAKTILRRSKPGEKPAQTAKRIENDYVKYSNAEELAQKDPNLDNALQIVGTEIGDGYRSIIKKQQELGNMIGKARREATTPVAIKPAQDFLENELKQNGVIITPRGPKIQKGYTSKLTNREINTLVTARKELLKLTKNPTAENLSNFKNRIAKDIDFSKPMGKSLPDAERIMRGTYDQLAEALNVKEAPDLQGLYAMNKEYERLSKLLDEGEGILGKKTLTGDFKHDAGLAKASIKSLHSGAKKDFLQALGKETGEDYIQKSMIAAQAMKDLGSYQQASLLEELATGIAGKNDQLRLSAGASGLRPSALIRVGLDKVAEKGRDIIAGTPKERTMRYIQEGAGKVKTRVQKASAKAKEAVPTKEEVGRVGRVIKEALRQAGYTTQKGGSQIRVRNAQILEMLGIDPNEY